MPLANVFLETLEHDVDDLRRRQIEEAQRALDAALQRRRAHTHRDPP